MSNYRNKRIEYIVKTVFWCKAIMTYIDTMPHRSTVCPVLFFIEHLGRVNRAHRASTFNLYIINVINNNYHIISGDIKTMIYLQNWV